MCESESGGTEGGGCKGRAAARAVRAQLARRGRSASSKVRRTPLLASALAAGTLRSPVAETSECAVPRAVPRVERRERSVPMGVSMGVSSRSRKRPLAWVEEAPHGAPHGAMPEGGASRDGRARLSARLALGWAEESREGRGGSCWLCCRLRALSS